MLTKDTACMFKSSFFSSDSLFVSQHVVDYVMLCNVSEIMVIGMLSCMLIVCDDVILV